MTENNYKFTQNKFCFKFSWKQRNGFTSSRSTIPHFTGPCFSSPRFSFYSPAFYLIEMLKIQNSRHSRTSYIVLWTMIRQVPSTCQIIQYIKFKKRKKKTMHESHLWLLQLEFTTNLINLTLLCGLTFINIICFRSSTRNFIHVRKRKDLWRHFIQLDHRRLHNMSFLLFFREENPYKNSKF